MSTTWTIDPTHFDVEFAVKHMMIATVKGRFADVKGSVRLDDAGKPEALEVTIATASIDTRQEQRDNHLKSADFFDVAQFPEMRFISTGAERDGSDWKVPGNLTIKGITKPVTLEVTEEGQGRDPWGNERMGVSARGKIDRREFGLTWNAALEAGGFLVGDDIKLTIEGELVKQGAAAKAA
jgi:polyisoprenoid-binding protein YceI